MLRQILAVFLLSIFAPSIWADSPCAKLDLFATVSAYVSGHPDDFPSTQDAPEPATTTEMIREGLSDRTVTLTELSTKAPTVRWIGIGWGGPFGGLLLAVDCQNNILGGFSGGRIEKISEGPALPNLGTTVLIEYTDTTGTGYLHKSIDIYAIEENKTISIWTHSLKESAFVIPDEPATVTNYQVNFDNNSEQLTVIGTVEIYPPKKHKDGRLSFGDKVGRVEHKSQHYCWDKNKNGYTECPKG